MAGGSGRGGPGGRDARQRRGVAVCAVLAALASIAPTSGVATLATTPLRQDGLAVSADGVVHAVPAGTGATYSPGSRVLAEAAATDPAAAALAAQQRAWLEAGTTCSPDGESPGAFADLVEGALLDLHVLLAPTSPDGTPAAPGALVAGWSSPWRYVWPRDAAFAALALAETGHTDDALAVLSFLAGVQRSDGAFAARYLPTGDGVPDAREDQLDGVGWVLWAADGVLARVREHSPAALASARVAVEPLASAATAHLLAVTDPGDGDVLPPASSDYWELPEQRLTLGTAGAVLTGLEAAARLGDVVGAEVADAAAARAGEVSDAVERAFGPGFRRYGTSGPALDALDASVAFLLPPFNASVDGVEDAWRASLTALARPAGGLAPGAAWRQDGVSWTPQTSLFALTAASAGDVDLATDLLTWLEQHRTASGALPEKVLADGSPAEVAPLAWTAATVVLAACALPAR
ncbi:glycoside hydrolase family 15 [Miniimonas arenae]|uniref:Glycoside hydrolase family 15 n=1 Tax=Miniimonas arenae TaxID=676201 RepID=A0A5C5BBQ7_9MICO|nr:glycoside hydrolase family 15 [Miniimonas arenae]TNU73306.1 glycoside hydrolase family 15 [Miniimonas arenae]